MRIPIFVVKASQHAAGVKRIDGKWGPKTLAALRDYDQQHDEFKIKQGEKNKLIVSVAQHAAGMKKRQIDGLYGPMTDKAVRAYVDEHKIVAKGRTKRAARKASAWAVWQPHEGPGVYQKDGIDLRDPSVIVPKRGLREIPTRRQLKATYGDAVKLGESGIKRRLTELRDLPGRFNKGQGVLYGVHKKAAPHLRLALELCEKFGVIDEIYRIGVFNYRHMRHDKNRPLSYHSYGIALDMNPRENFAWYPSKSQRSIKPFTRAWYKKYPRGLSEVTVLCFKKAGFKWGGDWPTFRDPMHFELTASRKKR